MKKLLAVLFCLPLVVSAAPISFNFTEVPLVTFSQSTFRNLLHVDYVIAPEVLAMDRRISLSIGGIDESKVLEFVEGILQQQGIAIEVKQGVYYLVASTKGPSAQPQPSNVAAGVVDSLPTGQKVIRVDGEELEHQARGRRKDDESEIYSPLNRPSDFLVSVLGAAFGKQSITAAGGDVLITGSKDELQKMRQLLKAVDSLPKLVDVSASWVEVTDNTSNGRGISLLASVLGAKLGVTLGTVNSGSAVSLKSTRFELVIDALKTDGRFKQVSNSRLVGDDYEKLVLTVGDETPTIASTGKDNAGNSVQNIVYRPSGVIVDVLPKVLGNGRIQMMLDGQISSFKSTANGVTGSPTLIKRQVKTKVTVEDGDVLLIGGLNDSQSSASTSALSFLPAWTSKANTTSQTDLVLVLSAKVVKH